MNGSLGGMTAIAMEQPDDRPFPVWRPERLSRRRHLRRRVLLDRRGGGRCCCPFWRRPQCCRICVRCSRIAGAL